VIRTLRKLVLGETWALPAGVAVAVCMCALIRVAAGEHGWWRDGGGFVLLALVVLALLVAVGRPSRRR
jgi:hypothetical protein